MLETDTQIEGQIERKRISSLEVTGKEMECKTENLWQKYQGKTLTEAERKQNHKIDKMVINKEDKKKNKG